MITKISKRLLISLSFIICHLSFSVAQTYTLEQLKQLAVDNNYSLRSARNSIQQSQEQKKSAFTNYFPRLSALGLGFTSNKYLIDVDIELPDVIASMIPQGLIPSNISMIKNGFYGSITALQPVFMGGQIINGNKLAKVGVQASEIQLEASEDQVELTTEQYYWQIVSLKEKLLTLGTVHEMLVELEKDVNNMVRVGAVNRNDLLQVQLRKGEVESTTLEVENGLNTIMQLLAQHVGKSDETIDVSLPESFGFDTVPALPVTLRQDHHSALTATPQYRLLEKNVESKRIQRNMTVGKNLPTVGVGASYSYNDFLGGDSNGMLFATVIVPISDWWGGSHNIKKRKLALADAEEQLQDNSQKLIIRMNSAWSAVETSHKKLLIARDAITQAEENLRLNKSYYRVGQTKMSDLLLAQEQFQQSRDRYTDAYADFQTKQLEYRQATGQD